MRQIIHNLLRNAEDALEGRESAHIVLTTELAGRYARLMIADNGPGFPVELLPRIFEPYVTTFQVLLGEMALQRGAPQLASDAWADLAERSRDPKVIARAVEVAGMAGQPERARHLIEIWLAVEPDSVKAFFAQCLSPGSALQQADRKSP